MDYPGKMNIHIDSIKRISEWKHAKRASFAVQRFEDSQVTVEVGDFLPGQGLLEGIQQSSVFDHRTILTLL